jgi:hypothetical protein
MIWRLSIEPVPNGQNGAAIGRPSAQPLARLDGEFGLPLLGSLFAGLAFDDETEPAEFDFRTYLSARTTSR